MYYQSIDFFLKYNKIWLYIQMFLIFYNSSKKNIVQSYAKEHYTSTTN